MSYDAVRWALAQSVDKSSSKFVLVALADCVNSEGGEMVCWPSVKHLTDATGQDRKTVMEGMRRLREAGHIEDTGDRKGATGQIVVYRLKDTKSGTVKPVDGVVEKREPEPSKSAEIGTGTQNGTVPNLDVNSTEFPYEESQISLVTVPKTGHGTSKEQGRNKEGTRKSRFDPTTFPLPSWLDRADWTRWCEDRKSRGKTVTAGAAPLQIKQLGEYRAQGFSPAEVIDHCIAGGYQGLYPPKRNAKPTREAKSFREIDYTEGVTDGIPDA